MRTILNLVAASAVGLCVGAAGATETAEQVPAKKPASAKEIVAKFTPKMVVDALDNYELTSEMRRQPSGNPLLIVKESELVPEQGLAVLLNNCDEADKCDSISFYTYFRTTEPLDDEYYHVWNDIFRVRTWSKVFKDKDGDTGFAMNVSAIGGTSNESLDFMVGVYLTEVAAFREALTKASEGSMTSAQLRDADQWGTIFADTFDAMALTDGSQALKLQQPEAPKDLMK